MKTHLFQSFYEFCNGRNSSYCDPTVGFCSLWKRSFHAKARNVLKEIAKGLGLTVYDLRSNKGGIAVSGEITLHADNLYIQISKGSLGNDLGEIMFRFCEGRRDYVGKTNNFLHLSQLADAPQLCLDAMRHVMENRNPLMQPHSAFRKIQP